MIEKTVLASDGKNYKVTVMYGDETGIPADAQLEVEEILPAGQDESRDSEDRNDDTGTSSAYDEYVSKTENALGMEEGGAGYIRLFDIKIVKDGEKVQPAEGASVEVKIELTDAESDSLGVVHFADGAEQADVIENSTESEAVASAVAFETTGFSVYAVVDLASPERPQAVTELDGNSYYIALEQNDINRYMTDRTVVVSGNTFVERTFAMDSAAPFTFELTEEDEFGNNYYIYTLDDEGRRR